MTKNLRISTCSTTSTVAHDRYDRANNCAVYRPLSSTHGSESNNNLCAKSVSPMYVKDVYMDWHQYTKIDTDSDQKSENLDRCLVLAYEDTYTC